MESNNFIKINVLAIVAVTAILSFLLLKERVPDGQQKRITFAIYLHANPHSPAAVAHENRWNVTPRELPINGLIKKPICYWLKIRI